MFSQSEYQYIKDLTLTYYNSNYKYYMCITNNPTNNSYYNVYDVYCYYSKDSITNNKNTFTIPNNTLKCSIDSDRYSEQNTIDKLSCESVSNVNITANTKEYVYSNVGNYPNIIQEYHSSSNYYYDSCFVLVSILSIIIFMFLYNFVRSMLIKR